MPDPDPLQTEEAPIGFGPIGGSPIGPRPEAAGGGGAANIDIT